MDVQVVGSAAAAQPQSAPLPAAPQVGAAGDGLPAAPHGESTGALSPVVAKLFGGGGMPNPVSVTVSYRVEHDPNMIVMVITDPATGREVAQVPSEVMVQIAQFFDKHSGVALDRSA